MLRTLALLTSSSILLTTAAAQCPQGMTAGLVKWTSVSGYTSTFAVADEGLTNPPLTLSPAFNMPGAVGTLDQLWINSNGELYLTDSTLALTQPANGASFGISTLAEMRGTQAGASARIAVCAADSDASVVAGAAWNVSVDQSVAGQTTVTWIDMRRFDNTTDRFSFKATLFHSSGVVSMRYGTTFPVTGFTGRFVGISIGNGVGTTTSPNSDMSATPDSGTVGLLYQNFTGTAPNVWDLSGKTLTISPNGTGGYVASALVPYVPPTCAFTASYGTGCYSSTGNNTLHQTFATTVAAKAALDANSMTFLRGASGYTAVWNGSGGPAFVAPGGGAVTLTFTNGDDGNVAFTPSAPIPVPGGAVATWNCSVNGILTANAAANNAIDFTPASVDVENATVAPNIAFYTWHDFTLLDTAPTVNGTITREEVGGILYLSWNAVEAYDVGTTLGTVNLSTWQYQVNMTTGDVTMVWSSMDTSATSAMPTVVAATLAGAGTLPGAVTLATGGPFTLSASINPLTLTASGRPVITLGGSGPSQNITLTATNIPDAAPPLGFALGVLIFSVGGAIPGGLDLGPAGIDVGMGGCRLYITSLDVILAFPTALGGTPSQVVFNSAIPQPLGGGLNFYAQALALFPPNSLPGGLNNFGGLVSNGIQLHFENQ
jgi:hypothetical protein